MDEQPVDVVDLLLEESRITLTNNQLREIVIITGDEEAKMAVTKPGRLLPFWHPP